MLKKEDDKILTRYMNLSKFRDLIQDRRVYFPSVKELQSFCQFEGKLPYIHRKSQAFPLNRTPDYNTEYYRVLCFYDDWEESNAMWKIYGDDNYSIRIRTTENKLFQSIGPLIASNREYIGKNVEYIYYEKSESKDCIGSDKFDTFELGVGVPQKLLPLFHRPKQYEYEKEYRLVIFPFFPDEGKEVDIEEFVNLDLEILLEEVRVSPNCPSDIFEYVQKLIDSAKLNLEAKKSVFENFLD